MKKIILILLMILCLFITACNKENLDLENNNIKHEIKKEEKKEEQKEEDYKITYVLNNEIWDEIYYSEFDTKLYRYCLNCSWEPKEVWEVEWYDENNVYIDEQYNFTGDTVLNGKVITKFELSYLKNKFLYITYSENDAVTLPNKYYERLSVLDVTSITLKTLFVDKISNYTTGILPDRESVENVLYTSSSHYRGEKLEISKITVYAESLDYIIHENCFANSKYIKEIEIIGDIKKIDYRAFNNLPNLEKVKIFGNVEEINEEYYYRCDKINLEISK